jgi:Amt family ammonium transporter
MPGAVATRGFSLKVAATADDRIEINSRATPARAVESSEHARSAPAAPAKKFAVPALAFAAAVAAMAPAGPAAAAAAAVATINQADTAWILISTGTSPNARPPGAARPESNSDAFLASGRNAARMPFCREWAAVSRCA